MKRLTRDWFRKEVVAVAALAEIHYDYVVRHGTYPITRGKSETFLSHPGRLAYCHLEASCYGNQTDVFCNNRYLTTFFRK